MFRLSIILLIYLGVVLDSSAQRTQTVSLNLSKRLPLNLALNDKFCDLVAISDSLKALLLNDGYKVIDSVAAKTLSENYFKSIFAKWKSMSPDEYRQFLENESRGQRVRQDLLLSTNSCNDSIYNFTISLYLFPQHKKTLKSKSISIYGMTAKEIARGILIEVTKE